MSKALIFPLLSFLCMSGCGSSSQTTTSGFVEGELDEKMETMFYDFTLSNPYKVSSYGESTPTEDKEYLVVELTFENTTEESYEVTAAEFGVAWGNGEEDYIAPTSYYSDTILDENEFPASYEIAAGEKKEWLLIFEVPSDQTNFIVYCVDSYLDKDGNLGTGAEYDIEFSAYQK